MIVSKISKLETSAWLRQSIVRSNSGVEYNLVDRMQSDQLPSNGAGHVIPSVLSNRTEFYVATDIQDLQLVVER